jgi:hypothetical protein
LILNTLNQEFKNIHVFVGSPGDLLIMAGNRAVTREDLLRADNIISNNDQLKKSLQEIKIESIDGILLREIINSSYISEHFTNYGMQTMDFPKLHYLAGMQFFLDFRMDLESILNSFSAPYFKEYLLSMKYDAEDRFPLDKAQLQRFNDSLKNIKPISDTIKLRAFLQHPEDFPLTDREIDGLGVDLVSLIMSSKSNGQLWERAGLGKATYRQKAETLLWKEKRTRNWLAPYQIEGLKVLLEEGMLNGKDVYEKNWSALQLVLLLFKEKQSVEQLQRVLSRTIKDDKGGIIIATDDKGLEAAALESLAKSSRSERRGAGQIPSSAATSKDLSLREQEPDSAIKGARR